MAPQPSTADLCCVIGLVVILGGLPGQQPDGQVDEAQPAVGVCRGVLVGGGGTQHVGQRESRRLPVSVSYWWLWKLLN